MSRLLRDARSIGAARTVLAELRFRQLAAACGRRVEAGSLDDLLAVPACLASELSTSVELAARSIVPPLAKYDIAHLDALVVGAAPEVPRVGARGLRALLGRSPATPDELDEESVRSFLEQVADDLREPSLHLVVFLDVVPAVARGVGWYRGRRQATDEFRRLPEGYFPRAFEITDAYLTNASAVSLLRRFYL